MRPLTNLRFAKIISHAFTERGAITMWDETKNDKQPHDKNAQR